MARPVRVMLVEQHPAVTYSVAQALADRSDIALVATRASPSGAVFAAAKVDVAIVDHERDGRNGLAVARMLTRVPNAPKVLVLSAYADARMTLAAAISGSDGLVSKSDSGEELCQVVSAVAAGGRHLAPVAMPAVTEVFGCLTPIERLIAAMRLAGAAEKHIAEILGVSEEHVDATCMRVLERIDAPGGAPGDRTGPAGRGAGDDPGQPGTIERAIMQRVEVG
jgi:DNA-binding NarL/FixJ family response regulator